MLGWYPSPPRGIAAIGAHCDDIAIGAGASLLAICSGHPGITVDALVLSGGGTERAAEEHAALRALCPGAELRVTVAELPDGRFPAYWDAAKSAVLELGAACDADLVLAPQRGDKHQDHRLLAELAPQVFRDHVILGYEIVKSDGDMGRPVVYHPLTVELAESKVAVLHEHYPSQHGRAWFDREAFLGLARIRGIECHAPYAEAFYTDKLTVGFRARTTTEG